MSAPFDSIVLDRERKNERTVAKLRLALNLFSLVADFAGYTHIIDFTNVTPTWQTLALDATLTCISCLVLVWVTQHSYWRGTKFATISLDYVLLTTLILFDPTVSQSPQILPWMALVAGLFVYSYNLLRFSVAGTLYAGAHAIAMFCYFAIRCNVADFVPMLFSLLMLLAIGLIVTISNLKMMREANAKVMMERFLAPELVSELLTAKTLPVSGGKAQRITILFADIRSFTAMAEKHSPEQVVHFLNDYLSKMTEIIFAQNGTVDKFIGDAVMAFFGAPRPTERDEENALLAAAAMTRALPEIAARHPGMAPLAIGIGIHTGEAIVGNIGSERRLDYTAIGDAVNLASRIEGLTKQYGCGILLSEATRIGLPADGLPGMALREIDVVAVRGKAQPTLIYEAVTT
ncbi:adenylate/guanylate cyclase domain-containing protein [Turneriella parva]|nr:adenylate/guanylate cyclase domain-containing protein [Turneriella parva]